MDVYLILMQYIKYGKKKKQTTNLLNIYKWTMPKKVQKLQYIIWYSIFICTYIKFINQKKKKCYNVTLYICDDTIYDFRVTMK